jgi:hypothetical protein
MDASPGFADLLTRPCVVGPLAMDELLALIRACVEQTARPQLRHRQKQT